MYKIKQDIYDKPRSPMGPGIFILITLIGILGGLSYLVIYKGWLGTKPQFAILSGVTGQPQNIATALPASRTLGLSFKIDGQGKNICSVKADLIQGEQKWSLFNQNPQQTIVNIKPEVDLSALGVKPEPLTVHLEARNCSLFKTKNSMTAQLAPDFNPPTIGITSQQHYINQGGADVVTYNVSPDTVWSGVRVGDNQFEGFDKPNAAAGEKFAFFVYSYNLPANAPITLVAIDGAGNEAKTNLTPARFFPKEFRQREMPVSDSFISDKIMTIINNTPGRVSKGDPVQDFIQVNRDLRKKNAQDLHDFSKQSEKSFLWHDAFIPLKNASVEAGFADYRSYIYNGQKIDEQVHLGFDLAITEHAPVYAAAAGKIMFAGYLGIYGNTILVDHGYGIVTLYAHLSSMDMAVGNPVEKGQKIGNSGTTGLAGGDHLHFSLLIQGVQTNPVEFWDQHWIDDHVYLRLGKEVFLSQASR